MRNFRSAMLLLAMLTLLAAYSAAAGALTYLKSGAATPPVLVAARATAAAPAQADTLPRCSPAPAPTGTVLYETGFDPATNTRTYEAQGTFATAYTNAPCFEDYYARFTDDKGAQATAVARYYFQPVYVPTPTPTPTPEPTPSPSPSPTPRPTPAPSPTATPTPTPASTPSPTPTPCPPGQKKKGRC